ncbi:RagB/SusD family nutrient uptake outer membrane protein [Flavobacterium sp. 3HN19-14]|uniref:RagB/SusD family nutrient uptake outer membrane protein n=1 Tax=Flavobacterium sp. 3HN19-14 TaxID=3448133 RepID=UPI003EE40C68
MKRKLIYSMVAFSLILSGCSDDFLDPVSTTELLSTDQLGEAAENNPLIIAGTVNGIYTQMIVDGSGGTTNHNDFGQKGVDIWTDMLSGDMALTANSYNWYRNFVNYQVTTDFTRIENKVAWTYYYGIIKSCNLAIAPLGGNDAVPELEQNRYLMGQAKALRAYAYFYLAQLYAKEYNPTSEILPIYTDATDPAQPKSTTADVYAQITKDLTDAISLLDGFERTKKNEVNKSVAQGLLAYTYAAMGDYAKVKTITDEIINTGEYPLTTAGQTAGASTAGFNNVATPSWMWGYDLTPALGINLISWWGQMDQFTYSYAWAGDKKSIDSALRLSIPAGDVRRTQFTGATGYMPVNKFFDANRVAGGQRFISADYIYMRVDEMYMLNAEASAKLGDDAAAKARLIEVLTNRYTSGATAANALVNPLSGQALIDEIYHQTRIEFWGEGKSYLAMKRNHATITRGDNHLFQAGVAVPYNDERLSFKIPQFELVNNPYITSQN